MFCYFIMYLEIGVVKTCFVGLVETSCENAESICNSIISRLIDWDLNLDRLVSFGLDDVFTMVGEHSSVVARLKLVINPYLCSCHCITHRTNLEIIVATKHPYYKEVCRNIDGLLNSVVLFFQENF